MKSFKYWKIVIKLIKLLSIGLTIFYSQILYGQDNCDKANDFLEKEKFKEAVNAYSDECPVDYYLNFAIAVAKNNYESKANEAFKCLQYLAKAKNTYNGKVYYYLGLYYKEGRGTMIPNNNDTAINYFLQSGTNDANFELARLYKKTGQQEKSIEYFKKTADLSDFDNRKTGEANYEVGEYYRQKGNQDEAIKYYRKAKKYEYSGAEEALDELLKMTEEITILFKESNKKQKPIAKKTVRIDGEPKLINDNGECKINILKKDRLEPEPKKIKVEVDGYEPTEFDVSKTIIYLTPKNWLISKDNEPYSRLNVKFGWGANTINFNTDNRDIETGWGNRFNAELNYNHFLFDKHLLFSGIGFRTASYPFSKIDTFYYENLSYNTAYVPIGGKLQIVRFIYLNFQMNLAYNFGAAYNNHLLDYELKGNKMITPFQIEFSSGLTLMKKGWGGMELNYGMACLPVLNKEFKQTINGIEFKPFEGVSSISHGLILNVIVFIPGIK